MKKGFALMVAAGLALALIALWLVRGAAFCVLLFLRPLAGLVCGWLGAGALVGLVLGLLIAPDKHTMLWALCGTGLAATTLLFCYDALVLALAPGRFPLLLVR